ncbi:MAG TPA: TIGR03032 family protein [Candidatus Binatia bacterium]|nr:TIGR03032 family protein [Candidatus Binatia bacterium]
MKLDTEFIQLPLRFDTARLQAELAQFAESEWRPHPQGYPGNWAIPLVAAQGDPGSDAVKGPMQPTPLLDRAPYMRQVLASFGCVLGRTRLMRLDSQAETTAHVDTNYYWLGRVRIHVPIVTFPEVAFHCGRQQLHMAAGECWLFDTWRLHNVVNPTPKVRTHLVCDTAGSPAFWEMVRSAHRPFAGVAGPAPRDVPWQPGARPDLVTERVNFPVVMWPDEQERLAAWLLAELARCGPVATVQQVRSDLRGFLDSWRSLWNAHRDDPQAWPRYRELAELLAQRLKAYGQLTMPNTVSVEEALVQAFVRPALSPELARLPTAAESPAHPVDVPPLPASTAPAAPSPARADEPRIERPLIIVSAPRSGSTLLFETLERSPDLRSIGGESHHVIEGFPVLGPEAHGWDSNRLTQDDASPRIRQLLPRAFLEQLRDARGAPPQGPVRLLEKTPKNALRIPMLKAVFPDALFIYLYREPRGALSSIIEAWRSGRFTTYADLPGWTRKAWSLLLVPGWRELNDAPLEEIALQQWASANRTILDDLAALPSGDWCAVDYDRFLRSPAREVQRLCAFAGVRAPAVGVSLPLSKTTVTAPSADKWKKNAEAIERVLPRTAEVARRAQALMPPPPGDAIDPLPTERAAPAASGAETPADTASKESPLKSVYTSNLYELLDRNRFSLLVTTYQAGKLVIVRPRDGALNTHFKLLPKPMGLDVAGNRMAVGARSALHWYRNVPALATRLDPPKLHDACFVPSGVHVTGDIDIHEMAFDRDGELWVVNTKFCCLCTLDAAHSFTPRWRPPFISALAPEDRCHLNGIGLRDGRVRYVSMLAQTDRAGAWREHKADGGTIMDVTTDAVVATGLSMPHSPRWYRDRLWILESGKGSLAWVDGHGRVHTVATLPGFTRGLDFVGPLAFIGLSQVRETAVFSGIPITERMGERNCGVWVVNIETGQQLGFIRFEGAVQEIFAVKALPGAHCPEILEVHDKMAESCYVLPDDALAQVARRTTG